MQTSFAFFCACQLWSERGGESAGYINPGDLSPVFTHGTGIGLGCGREVPLVLCLSDTQGHL